MSKEWRWIEGYKDAYMVSDYGDVKSFKSLTPRILSLRKSNSGRPIVSLYHNGNVKEMLVSRVVFKAFKGYLPSKGRVVDHIDNNPSNNRFDNLQDITQRENTSKDRKNKTSKFTGVSKHKKSPNWIAQIHMDGKMVYIGTYKTEDQAKDAYNNKLKSIENV